jgi:hypothetical protein
MSNRITSDHYGARRAAAPEAPKGRQSSLTPSADARMGRLNVQGGVQFSTRQPHQLGGETAGTPTMRSNHYGGRALHAAPQPPPTTQTVDLDEVFGSDDELDAELEDLLADDE